MAREFKVSVNYDPGHKMNNRLKKITYEIIESAVSKNLSISFVTAGGGVGLYQLFTVPGCSKVLAEARMLYNAHSFASFFSSPINDKFVSQDMADIMVKRLYDLTDTDLSFSLTSAFKTNRVRRDSDHGFMAIYHQERIVLRQKLDALGDSRDEQDINMSIRVMEIVLDYIQ